MAKIYYLLTSFKSCMYEFKNIALLTYVYFTFKHSKMTNTVTPILMFLVN